MNVASYIDLRRLVSAIIAIALLSTAPPQASAQLSQEEQRALAARLTEPLLDDPLKRPDIRILIVLMSPSRTNFFVDDTGRKRGFEYELIEEYKKFLNRGKKSPIEKYELIYLPTAFDQLLPALAEGRGDIAAANLTITPQRQALTDFTDPYLPQVSEVVVVHQSITGIESVDDLAGRTIYVRAGSSYVTHLEKLNQRFEQEGKSLLDIIEADPELVTSDILEMVNTGVIEITVADHHLAELWSRVLPDIVVRKDVVLHTGGEIAWAVRKNAPKLKASLNEFVASVEKGTLLGNVLFKRYYQDAQWVKNPLDLTTSKRLEQALDAMKRYAEEYSWDWIAVAAQGYQESRLDQNTVSAAGAVGIMQLLPTTATGDPINIENIKTLENNIHAGVKYLAYIRKRYFDDPEIEPAARVDFSWAAYNAGPAKIRQLRKKAAERGYDPNKWFGNVEHIAAEVIGRETVQYVANVNKYYAIYKYGIELREQRADKRKAAGLPEQN